MFAFALLLLLVLIVCISHWNTNSYNNKFGIRAAIAPLYSLKENNNNKSPKSLYTKNENSMTIRAQQQTNV